MAEHALPPVVARMWGRETASRHGPRPSLDVATIVNAAIRIADRDGLEGVRMSSVAAEVGVATMSLYRYVGSKDELLQVMADAATPEPPALDGRRWRDYLTEWTRANRDFLLDRPWLLPLIPRTPPAGPRTLRWLDRALGALAGTGLRPGERINIATSLTGYATWQAALAHGLTGGAGPAAGDDPIAGLAAYGDILGQVLDPAEYPDLAEAVRGDGFGSAEEWVDDADFTFGLDLLLDGVQALIDRRT
ncbi:TetR/AcrR family transcriptional regulator [Micromonospora sp. NPDC050397]|uniref:TetR/AcrR family transcriptional regulator n=1 Tax=Micromonospora sp. NPDC050397 TaxID=3364279 RepID=UPI00384B5295